MKKILNIVYFFTIGAMVCFCEGDVITDSLNKRFDKVVNELVENINEESLPKAIDKFNSVVAEMQKAIEAESRGGLCAGLFEDSGFQAWMMLWESDVARVRKILEHVQKPGIGTTGIGESRRSSVQALIKAVRGKQQSAPEKK